MSVGPVAAILFVALLALVQGALKITVPGSGGPFANMSIYSTPWSAMTGPQEGDGKTPLEGTLFVFRGDPCDRSAIPDVVGGHLIYITALPQCLVPIVYFNFMTKNASAVLHVLAGLASVPGVWYNARFSDTTDKLMRASPMLYLDLQDTRSHDGSTLLSAYMENPPPGLVVTVTADNSQWIPTFSAWWYDVLTQWIPAAIYLGTAMMACVMLFYHLVRIQHHLKQNAPGWHAAQATYRKCIRIYQNLGIRQLILIIEVGHSIVIGYVYCALGRGSSPRSYPMQAFFFTALGGFRITCDVLCAKLWNRLRRQTADWDVTSEGCFTRAIQHHVIGSLLVAIPVVCDLIMSTMFMNGRTGESFNRIVGPLLVFIQLTFGLYFFFQQYQFHQALTAMRITRNLPEGVPYEPENAVRRIAIWKRCLGAAILLWVAMVLGVSPYVWSPTVWTVFWCLTTVMSGLAGFFRVMMCIPRLYPHMLNGRGFLVSAVGMRFVPAQERVVPAEVAVEP